MIRLPHTLTSTLATLAIFATVPLLADPAAAKCRKMGFTVNDYGKEGPTADAKSLLDKHIAEWAASQGIRKFTTGKKDVSCELFLDVILFDEHTCTASATVCWDEPGATPAQKDAQVPAEPAKEKSAAAAEKDAPKKAAQDAKPAPGSVAAAAAEPAAADPPPPVAETAPAAAPAVDAAVVPA
ncbi:MAG: hypothetical protein ACT4N2_09375, partial [Hyphomicrobium sp.]